jgi:quercetin dioxygenase-like cupin family protein
MKVVTISDVQGQKVKNEMFVGDVVRKQLIDESMAKVLLAGVVYFAAGSKNNWHTHSNEQILYVVDGKGIVATEKEQVVVTPGMIVHVPAGEKNWHGATEDTPFTQLSLYHPGETKILK